MAPRTTSPQGLDRQMLRRLLRAIDTHATLDRRIETAAFLLLGVPYRDHPLIGSAETSEAFTVLLAGFDCVTYVETVLALALARDPRHFVEAVRRIRYDGGRVEWRRRNHYMTGWVRANSRAGLVRLVRLPAPGVVRVRRLSVLPGLTPRTIRLRCVPKRAFWRVRDAVRTGDLLMFASTRRNRDVFHVGLAVWNEGTLCFCHASRSRGRVVEQDLAGFLKANTMAGVIVARPSGAGGGR
jgi:hypothetical protein